MNARPGYNYVHKRLAIGSAPIPGITALPFDVLVLCAQEYQPTDKLFPNIRVLHVPFDDAESISKEEAHRACRGGAVVAQLVRDRQKVLVTCMAGRNRSGLVTGFALMNMGYSAPRSIKHIRECRGENALSNQFFVRLLCEYGKRSVPR